MISASTMSQNQLMFWTLEKVALYQSEQSFYCLSTWAGTAHRWVELLHLIVSEEWKKMMPFLKPRKKKKHKSDLSHFSLTAITLKWDFCSSILLFRYQNPSEPTSVKFATLIISLNMISVCIVYNSDLLLNSEMKLWEYHKGPSYHLF